MNLSLCQRSFVGLLFVFLLGSAARAADVQPIEPPGVRTKSLEAKLAELKRRGLDYSDAVAFWPLGDGQGIVLRTFGTLGKGNPWLLATAAIDCEWTKESRFKDHAALRCKPPLSTINGGARVVAWKDGPLTALTVAGWCRPEWFRGGGSIFAEGWALRGMDFSLRSHKTKARASVTLTQENKAEQIESPETELPGGWAHAVFVYDGPNRKLSLYLNGKRVAQRFVPASRVSAREGSARVCTYPARGAYHAARGWTTISDASPRKKGPSRCGSSRTGNGAKALTGSCTTSTPCSRPRSKENESSVTAG